MSKNICTKFYPDWLSLRWVFKICRMLRMESQIYNGVDTCYLTLDKRGRLPFNGHHISNEESSRRKMASVHCNSDRPLGYIKVCNKNGREATEISRIFLYFCDFFLNLWFFSEFSQLFSKFFQNFADFYSLSLIKSIFFIDFVKENDDFICEAE